MMIHKIIVFGMFLLLPIVGVKGQKVPENQWFFIQSAQEYEISNKGYWDLPGELESIGAGDKHSLKVWEKGGRLDRQYSFMNKGGNVYDIAAALGANTHLVKMEATYTKNGANIQLEGKKGNGSDEIFNRQLFTVKYVGAGRWKIYSDDGRVMCLDNRSSKNGSNIHLWEDHDGAFTEWVFIDVKTKKAVYPIFPDNLSNISHGGRVTNAEILNTIKNIDQTYVSLYNSEKKVFQEMLAINKSNRTMRKAKSIVDDFGDLSDEVGTISSVLGALAKVPYVKVVALPVSTTVDKLSSKLESSNEQVAKMGDAFVMPTHDRFSEVKNAVNGQEAEFAYALNVLIKMKKAYVKAASAISSDPNAQAKFASHTTAINKSLSKMRSVGNSLLPDFKHVRVMNQDIELISGTVNGLSGALHKISNSLSLAKDASDKIDDVMSEEFVGVSLKDILNGAEIPGVDAVIDKGVSKIAGLLDIEFPSVPGVDQFKSKVSDLKNRIGNVEKSQEMLVSHLSELHSATVSLRQPFFMSLAAVPLEHMQQARLVEYSAK